MKQEIDIYNYPNTLASALRNLEKYAISVRNKELIMSQRLKGREHSGV